jgi:hypothetical protein
MTSVMNYEVYIGAQLLILCIAHELLILLCIAHETIGSDYPLTKHHISEEWNPYIFCCFCGGNVQA